MIDPYDAHTLDLHQQKIARIETDLQAAKNARDEQVRGMLRKGAGPTELGKMLGVTRARIYQIRDRH